jgi:hypothetical protein
MKRLVKVYIDVPSHLFEKDLIEEFFTDALAGHGGQYHPTDPRRILGSAMTIDRIQVGAKVSTEEA